MTEFTTEFLSGTIYWAKVFRAVDNYEKTGKEWTYNFIPDEKGVEILKKHRLLDRLKEPNEHVPGEYLTLRKPETNKEGIKNDPIKVVTSEGEEWDVEEMGVIGNASKGDIRLTIADFGRGMKKALWTNAIRVNELVPHEGGPQAGGDPFAGFEGGSKKGAPPARKPKTNKPKDDFSDLDDDVPF